IPQGPWARDRECKHATDRDTSPYRDIRPHRVQLPLLYRGNGDAAGEALRESGRRERVPPLLRRRQGEPWYRPHLFRLAGAAGAATLAWWRERLRAEAKNVGEIVERDGRMVLDFEDSEGQRLSLVDDGGAGDSFPWERSPVPAEHQVRGLGPIMISVPNLATTDSVLQRVAGMRPVREYPHPDYPSHTVHV